MCIIGITGGSGSGKSYICNALGKIGYNIIDADCIARNIVLPGKPALNEIVSEFGPEILLADGTLNRKFLGSIVFTDAEKLQLLNQITHKYIIAQIKTDLELCKMPHCVIDAPLLYTCGLDVLCDTVIGVTASLDVRIERIVIRDGITREAARNRIESQKDIEQDLKRTDMILDTTNNPDVKILISRIIEHIKGV